MEVIWAKSALLKLNKYVDYIARDDFQTAKNWVNSVISQTDKLSSQPEIGRIVQELSNPALREQIIGNYRIIYKINFTAKKVIIQMVRHVRQSSI
jgi:plasmid stabilization system protein ParE